MFIRHVGMVEFAYAVHASEALSLARERHFDAVIVDQRGEAHVQQLLLPLLAAMEHRSQIIVISPFARVSDYLRVPGVARVLSLPVRQSQLLRVLGLAIPERQQRRDRAEKPAPQAAKPSGFKLSAFAMTAVSNAYKRGAFVLLATLFAAFSFYGVLIGYFLLSSNWGAPVTLSHGHELVSKAEQQLNDLRVSLNVVSQRLSDAELEQSSAERAHGEARILVNYAAGTVDKEIAARKRRNKSVATNITKLEKTRKAMERQLKAGGMSAELENLYNKRLIDKTAFMSSTLGMLEAGQRLMALEGQIEDLKTEQVNFESTVAMLNSLKDQLEAGQMSTITAADADLILLTKQAVDARSAFDQSKARMDSAEKNRIILADSEALLRNQIAKLEASPLGRAVTGRVDVMFVPYGNEHNFRPGAPLYSCAFTIIWCSRAGTAGEAIPGESNAVHPFFGKPIRGIFVEAEISDPEAATREIIHVNRPPFFF
jgi:predicted nucleic acid-binding protein